MSAYLHVFPSKINPLVVRLADDDRLRRNALGVADLFELYGRLLLRLNDPEADPQAASRRETGSVALNLAKELRGMCVVAALCEESQGLTLASAHKAEQE